MKKLLGVFLSLSMIAGQVNVFAAEYAAVSSVTASSYYSSGFIWKTEYPASNATDSNASTYWQSASSASTVESTYSEKYLQLDLGAPKKISAVELSAKSGSDAAERTNFELRLSNSANFENYVKVPCVITTDSYPDRLRVGAIYADGETYRREIDLPDKYRYVRYVKLTGTATLSEIKVETTDDTAGDDVENTNPEDFEIDASLTDAAGDRTNLFVKNSNMVFSGELKNNTDDTAEVYSIAASYDTEGRLSSVDVATIKVPTSEKEEFSAQVNVGTDSGRVSGYLFEKNTLKPLCQMYDTVEYYTQNTHDVFVSQENGDDTEGDGTILKPYKTLAAAETKAATLTKTGAVNVYIKNGEYYVTETVDITTDGNSSSKPITYKGFGTDETLVSGGTKVTGFTPEGNGVYSATVDLNYIADIYVNDERRYVASTDVLVAESEVYDTTNSIYGPVVDGALLPDNLTYTEGMEIFYPAVKWRSYTYKLQNITSSDGSYTLAIVPNARVINREASNNSGLPTDFDDKAFYLRNSKQLLDEEGEWYFDKTAKKLYYIPYSDEDINECEVYASGAVDTIIRIKNGGKNRSFDGLTFAHTGWASADEKGEMRWQGNEEILATAYGSAPHNITIPGALQTSYSNYINVTNCIFKHTGAAGVVLSSKTGNNTISGNVFTDIADSAMYIGYYNETYKYKVTNTNITNNVISGAGKKYSASALTVFGATNTNITHNDISDCPYTAIHAGPMMWTNEFTSESTADHEEGEYSGSINISYNNIHEIAKTNVDGAGIYTLGHNHGSVISNNYIKNQYIDYSAIYNDDGSACFDIHDNVSENVPGWLYNWTFTIYFINASNNYSTTDEDYDGLKSSMSSIEDVKVFSSSNKPQAVQNIIANAGLESEYKEKIGHYISEEPTAKSQTFTSQSVTAGVNQQVVLRAGFSANDSGRYRWKAIGSNKSYVTFKDSLTDYWNKGIQFENIYAMFSKAGTYEVVCEADDGRGYIYANKQTITVR